MMKYFLNVFRSASFRQAPLATLANAARLAVLLAFRRSSVIELRFGSTAFKFHYWHGKRHGGGRGLYLFRERIEDLMRFGDQFLRRGDVAIDGGANQGMYATAFANYVGPEGRVIAFEPMPYAAELTEANLALNGLANCTVIAAALSDRPGRAELDLTRGVGSASIVTDYGGASRLEVPTVTIDDTLAELGVDRIDFIKLDIEGAELKALEGARKTIARSRPVICLEIAAASGTGAENAAHYHLLELGYRAHHFVRGRLTPLARLDPPHANLFYLPGG